MEDVKKQFLFQILSEATLEGEGEKEAVECAANMNPDLQRNSAKQMRVWDSTGKPLIQHSIYKFRGDLVTILSERFGCGNIADTYYYVNYRKADGEDGCVCIDQNGGGMFSGWTYRSTFEPITE